MPQFHIHDAMKKILILIGLEIHVQDEILNLIFFSGQKIHPISRRKYFAYYCDYRDDNTIRVN